MTPDELIAEAFTKLQELRVLANAALAAGKARLERGEMLTRDETRALNRTAALARYVADCAHRSRYTPPPAKRRGPRVWIPPET